MRNCKLIVGNTLPQYRHRQTKWYRCAEEGCSNTVDRPDTVCWPCTMAFLHEQKAARATDEPRPAA